MKHNINTFLTNNYFLGLFIILISAAFLNNLGVLILYIGLLVVFLTLWSGGWNWDSLLLKNNSWKKSLKHAFVLTIPVYVAVFFIYKFVETTIGSIDLSSFDTIKGQPKLLLYILLFSWFSAALGEELFFRGYLLNRLKALLKTYRLGNFLALIISSLVFAFAHIYQGLPGVANTFLIGMLLGGLLLKFKNLKLVILLHAIIDTISLTLLYFDIL